MVSIYYVYIILSNLIWYIFNCWWIPLDRLVVGLISIDAVNRHKTRFLSFTFARARRIRCSPMWYRWWQWALCTKNTHSCIFIVLACWNNSHWADISFPAKRFFIFLITNACLADKQQYYFQYNSLWFTRLGLEPTIHNTRAEHVNAITYECLQNVVIHRV